jgi:hypothetical protein
LLHQVGDLFELNVKLRCRMVNINNINNINNGKNMQLMRQEWTIVSNVNVLEWQKVVDTGKICKFFR